MSVFLFNATATTDIYTYCHTLSLHDARPIFELAASLGGGVERDRRILELGIGLTVDRLAVTVDAVDIAVADILLVGADLDRKSTRLNSSHYCAYRMPSSA